jgi:hypothetical protein
MGYKNGLSRLCLHTKGGRGNLCRKKPLYFEKCQKAFYLRVFALVITNYV